MSSKSKATATYVFRHGDVSDVLRTLPSKKYGLIISSPPYNIGKDYERQSNLSFEKYVEWLDGIIGELVKHLADTGIISDIAILASNLFPRPNRKTRRAMIKKQKAGRKNHPVIRKGLQLFGPRVGSMLDRSTWIRRPDIK